MMDVQLDRDHLEERRVQVARDLAELEEQVAEGEVAPETADRLHDVYTTELLEIEEALSLIAASEPETPVTDEVTAASGDSGLDTHARRGPGFSTRAAVGAALLLGVITALIVWAGGGFPLPGSQDDVASPGVTVPGGPIDIAAMSTAELEAMLAEFPASVEVRLALADRHLAEGDTEGAIEHYAAVAEGDDATPLERSRALARIGYLAYATGQLESARQSLMESLELNENNTESALYLGYVLLNGFNAPQAAIPYLEQALADPAMPPNIVEDIEQMLDDAHQAVGD